MNKTDIHVLIRSNPTHAFLNRETAKARLDAFKSGKFHRLYYSISDTILYHEKELNTIIDVFVVHCTRGIRCAFDNKDDAHDCLDEANAKNKSTKYRYFKLPFIKE